MSRSDAAKWWAGIYSATLPYIRQRLATLTVKPEGSPDGEPIPLPWSYAEDEALDHLELTHTAPHHEDEPLGAWQWCGKEISEGAYCAEHAALAKSRREGG
jgi:hypothetical protein